MAMFSDPAYLAVLSALFNGMQGVSYAESGTSAHVINAWSYYLTPLGLTTVGLNVILRIVICMDLMRLPDSFYENYKE